MVACCLMVFLGSVAIASGKPPVVDDYDWLNADPPPSVEMLDWEASGGGDYEQRFECDADMPFSCINFDAEAPLIRAGSPGTYPAGSSVGWVYTVPGGPDSYIKEVYAGVSNVQFSPTPAEPHAYLGLWNGSSWSELETSDELAAIMLDNVAGSPGDRQLKFGLKADSTVTATDDHWATMPMMKVTLGDDGHPVLDYDSNAIPTGWVNGDPFPIPAVATDEGLGVEFILALGSKRHPSGDWATSGLWGNGMDASCRGNTEEPCPLETDENFNLWIEPAQLREGHNSVFLAAIDANDNLSNDGLGDAFDLSVDTRKPAINLTGSFMGAPGMVLDGPSYTVNSNATDGQTGEENSGVVNLQVMVDNVVIDSDSGPCATENCPMNLSTVIDPDDYSNGPHQLKVRAVDAVDHVLTQTVNFTVDR